MYIHLNQVIRLFWININIALLRVSFFSRVKPRIYLSMNVYVKVHSIFQATSVRERKPFRCRIIQIFTVIQISGHFCETGLLEFGNFFLIQSYEVSSLFHFIFFFFYSYIFLNPATQVFRAHSSAQAHLGLFNILWFIL